VPEDTEGALPGSEDPSNDEVTDQGQETLQTEEEDPIEAAIKARFDAEAERLRSQAIEEARREYSQRLEEDRRAAQEEAQVQQLAQSFGLTVRQVRDNLKNLDLGWDDQGNKRNLSDEEIQRLVVEPIARYNLVGEQATLARFRQHFAETALDSLPEDVREDFAKKATGKDLKEWFDHYVEARAANSNWAKQRAKEEEARIKAAEARGYQRGQSRPAPPPSTEGQVARSPGGEEMDLTTVTGVARARAQGLISEAEFLKRWDALRQ
jgi:hypothetical protein